MLGVPPALMGAAVPRWRLMKRLLLKLLPLLLLLLQQCLRAWRSSASKRHARCRTTTTQQPLHAQASLATFTHTV